MDEGQSERRTISGEQRISLPHSETIRVPAKTDEAGDELRALLAREDIDGFIDDAFEEPSEASDAKPEALIPISEGTVQLPRFRDEQLPQEEPAEVSRPAQVAPRAIAPPHEAVRRALGDLVVAIARLRRTELVAAAALFATLLGLIVLAGSVAIVAFFR